MAKTSFKKAAAPQGASADNPQLPTPARPLPPMPVPAAKFVQPPLPMEETAQVMQPPAPPAAPMPVPTAPQVPVRQVAPKALVATVRSVNPVSHAPTVPTYAAPAPRQPQQIQTYQSRTPAVMHQQEVGTIMGQVDSTDLQLSILRVAQFIGDDVQKNGFSAGDIVMDHVLGLFREGLQPVRIIVMLAKKLFVEDIPFGQGMPRLAETADEVYALGGTVHWINNEKPTWAPMLRCGVLIEKPEVMFNGNNEAVESALFHLEHNGKRYARASMQLQSTGYKAAKTVFTMAQQYRLHTITFEYATRLEQGKINSYYVPTLRFAGVNDESLINWATGVHAGLVSNEEAAE